MEWWLIVLIAYIFYWLRTIMFLLIHNNLKTKRDKLEAILWVIPLSLEVYLIVEIFKEIISRIRKRLN